MEKQMNEKGSKRDSIRNGLKGTLSSWKLDPLLRNKRSVKIDDRTPQPGMTEKNFEDMYEMGKKIGEGGSGCVNICRSLVDGKIYAVKRLRGDVEMLMISKRIFKIMKNLNNVNVIKVKNMFLDENSQEVHIVMQYCDYPTLYQVYQQISYQKKKNIVNKILGCLVYLHGQGVCHRDIKLENILYNKQDQDLKIIDFGISKKKLDRDDDGMKMWTITGTLHYMAPQMLGGGGYDQKVDIWAFGVLVYKLFYLRFPFDSEYKYEMIEKIRMSQPEYEELDPILIDFIKHLIYKESRGRMSAFECLKHPWVEKDLGGKQRLGSGDDLDVILEYRIRNYSEGIYQSPRVKMSKQQKIEQLRELNIFENKKKYGILAVGDDGEKGRIF